MMQFRQSPMPVPVCTPPDPRIPRCWLMIDQRGAASVLAAIRALPARSVVVVRPDALAADGRAALIRAIRRAARARRHVLLIAAPYDSRGYDGSFGEARRARPGGFVALPVHDEREAAAARRARATAVLVSPVFATRSHPGAAVLGMRGFARLARSVRCPSIALGGMDAAQFVAARRHGARGWAAIDAWIAG